MNTCETLSRKLIMGVTDPKLREYIIDFFQEFCDVIFPDIWDIYDMSNDYNYRTYTSTCVGLRFQRKSSCLEEVEIIFEQQLSNGEIISSLDFLVDEQEASIYVTNVNPRVWARQVAEKLESVGGTYVLGCVGSEVVNFLYDLVSKLRRDIVFHQTHNMPKWSAVVDAEGYYLHVSNIIVRGKHGTNGTITVNSGSLQEILFEGIPKSEMYRLRIHISELIIIDKYIKNLDDSSWEKIQEVMEGCVNDLGAYIHG